MKMKKKIFVLAITFSMLLSLMFVAVESEAFDVGIDDELQIAKEIHDWYDLDAVREDLNHDYVLMNDLDEDTDGYDELVNTEEGWKPIGYYNRDQNSEFNGTFDGDGYEIIDLYINRPETRDVGLFGSINNGAEITNLGIVDAEVNGDHYVGALIGYNSGSVSNSYVTGNVRGNGWIGGLVGWNFEGIIENSYASGEVDGENNVGGLVGINLDSTVSNSYAAATVSGTEYVGGLVGYNDGNIYNSYALGEVSGTEFAGGIVGYSYDGTIEKSYSLGEVSGTDYIGGLVGRDTRETVSDSFWNTETSGTEESAGGTGKTTAEMKDVATYTDTATEGLEEPWDFVGNPYEDEGDEDIWHIDEGIKEGYPFLSWEKKFNNAYFEVEITDYDDIVEEGEDVTVKFTIKNTGILEGTQDIVFSVDGTGMAKEEDITIESKDHWKGEFTWEAEEAGEYKLEVASDDTSDRVLVTIEGEATYYQLTINIEGKGAVEVNGEDVGEVWTSEFEEDTDVNLKAIPEDDWEFNEWIGTDETGEEITITINEEIEITARFVEKEDEDDDSIIPGFNSTLLLVAVIIALVIYKKERVKSN